MGLRYSYHSATDAGNQRGWLYFLMLLWALFMLWAAITQFNLYFTSWSAADENGQWKHLGLGIIYLLVGGGLTWYGLRLKNVRQEGRERYVRINDTHLVWDLTQVEGEQSVALADIVTVDRPNIRDLNLTLRSEQIVTLPVFLIADEGQQDALFAALESAIG